MQKRALCPTEFSRPAIPDLCHKLTAAFQAQGWFCSNRPLHLGQRLKIDPSFILNHWPVITGKPIEYPGARCYPGNIWGGNQCCSACAKPWSSQWWSVQGTRRLREAMHSMRPVFQRRFQWYPHPAYLVALRWHLVTCTALLMLSIFERINVHLKITELSTVDQSSLYKSEQMGHKDCNCFTIHMCTEIVKSFCLCAVHLNQVILWINIELDTNTPGRAVRKIPRGWM